MRKESLALLIIFALVFGIFVTGFVAAESLLDKINLSGSGDFLDTDGFKKFLLFVLVALIVYGIGGFLPFTENKAWVNGAIAIVVAFLSTWYLLPEEIQAILLSYGALGIILTGVVPWLAIAAISKKANDKGYGFVSRFLWVAFILILALRIVDVDEDAIGVDLTFAYYAYIILAIAALVMFLWEKHLFRKAAKEQAEANIERYADKTTKAAAKTKADAAAVDDVAKD
jgi:hypothetical protein